MVKCIKNRYLVAVWCMLGVLSAAQAVPPIPADYSVYPHLDHTAFLAGNSNAVISYTLWDRDYFALTNENTGLHLYEVVGDEVVARGIGATTGADMAVAVRDWYAFVATGSGLSAVNIAVPEAPFQVGFLNLPDASQQIAVSATHAFLACGEGGLVVVDITDPANMQVVDQGYGQYVTSPWYDDGRLGITNNKSFELLDVTDPTSPVPLGSYDLGQNGYHCLVRGDVAYLTWWNHVRQLDLSDPGAINVAKTIYIESSHFTTNIGTNGHELIIAGTNGLNFLDIASGTVARSSRQVGQVVSAAAIGGKIMAVGPDRVEFFTDGTHANPSAVEVGNGGLLEQRGVILGDYLYGLSLADPNRLVATEVDVGEYLWWNLDLNPGGSAIRGMAHRDDMIAALSSTGTLSIATVTRFTATRRGRLDLAGGFHTPNEKERTVAFLDEATVVVLDQNYGAGRDSYGSVRVVDVTDPDQPAQIGNYTLTLQYPEQIMVAGDLVLVAMYGGYEIFDAADRYALQSKGVHPGGATGNGTANFYTKDSYLYILLNRPFSDFGDPLPETLETWDLSDPAVPVQVDQMNLASPGHLDVAGDWAYQAESGLVIDLADPAHPVAAGNFSPRMETYFPLIQMQAGPETIVVEYRAYGTDPERLTLYLPAQGSSGPVTAVGEELPGAGSALALRAVPNPFNPRVTFSFELASPATARLQVFDLRGRLVADLGEDARTAGYHEVAWNGVDRQGRNLPSGVYLARISTPTGAASRKIVLAR